MEFSFVPTRESPVHDHADFLQTMRWYYPFLPSPPNRLNAWKQQDARVELAWSGGHQVRFPRLRMYPKSFPMRHYLFLSLAHAAEKYIGRSYDPGEVATGWTGPGLPCGRKILPSRVSRSYVAIVATMSWTPPIRS